MACNGTALLWKTIYKHTYKYVPSVYYRLSERATLKHDAETERRTLSLSHRNIFHRPSGDCNREWSEAITAWHKWLQVTTSDYMGLTFTASYRVPKWNFTVSELVVILLTILSLCCVNNPLRPSGNYMNHLLWQSVMLHFVFIGFSWFSL
jgi:hypothetical protein